MTDATSFVARGMRDGIRDLVAIVADLGLADVPENQPAFDELAAVRKAAEMAIERATFAANLVRHERRAYLAETREIVRGVAANMAREGLATTAIEAFQETYDRWVDACLAADRDHRPVDLDFSMTVGDDVERITIATYQPKARIDG